MSVAETGRGTLPGRTIPSDRTAAKTRRTAAMGRVGVTPSRRSHAKNRLTLRGKVVLACLVANISRIGWSAVSHESAQSSQGAMEVVNYTVRPGDTLWSYANQITPAGGDVSESVDTLMDLNDLDTPQLHPGQNLIVPAQH